MIKHIYAHGDSFTFGQELGGCDFKDFYNHTPHMQKHGYVGLLRDHYGIEGYTNEATPGGSNDRIVRQTIASVLKLLETVKHDELFVLIGWTELNRREFFHVNDRRYYNYLNNMVPKEFGYKEFTEYYTTFFDDFEEHASRFVTHLMSLQSFLKLHNIPYLFTNSLNDVFNWNYNEFFSATIKNAVDWRRYPGQTFCNFVGNKCTFGPHNHPLEDGHRIWADYVIEYIDKNKILEL